jgi:phosphate:Na+ symporter
VSVLAFLFGLALFLYSMHQLEAGIRAASGQGLKNLIIRNTNTPISAAGSGVIVTAVLQSSSMVSVLALAFVSAGVMPLFNGIGVVLGANLGTTMTGWIVTTIGFKMNLQALVPPLLGLGAAANLGYLKSPRLKGVGNVCLAFGLLIFGLDIMKNSVAGFSQLVDIATLQNIPPIGYLLVGVVLAAVMQSSSAVMIITLSLLSTNLLNLVDAAALVIGADLGTTSTTVLASFGESIVKKQLAFAHVFFNVVVDSFAFLILLPLLPKALNLLNIQDSMFGVVSFHSLFNLFGLLIFLPLLTFYTSLIERLIPTSSSNRPDFFNVPVEVPELAINDLKNALRYLNEEAIKSHMMELGISLDTLAKDSFLGSESRGNFQLDYQNLKDFEDQYLHYANKLQLAELELGQGESIIKMLEAARATVYASKTLKDFRTDFEYLHQSFDNPLAQQLLSAHKEFLSKFYQACIRLLHSNTVVEAVLAEQNSLRELNDQHYQQSCDLVARSLRQEGQAVGSISTLFNLNHELHHYARYMLSALVANNDADLNTHS